jgi:hypothetical protein
MKWKREREISGEKERERHIVDLRPNKFYYPLVILQL